MFVFENFIQYAMVNAGNTTLGSNFFGTAPLTMPMWITSWICGIFTLVVGVIAKLIPIERFRFIQIDLE